MSDATIVGLMAPRMQELPDGERPRERLTALAPDALSARELLTILLGSGSAGRSAADVAGELLARFGSLRRLATAETAELERVTGIGFARACVVVAAFELGRRLAAEPSERRVRIRGPADVFRRLGPHLRDRRQEEFWALYLDTQNAVLSERRVTVGLLNSSLVHPREVFSPAITWAAASIVLVHNHPSGDPDPSPEDLEVTFQLVESGRLIGIPVRDHIVIGDGRYASLLERGLMALPRAPASVRAPYRPVQAGVRSADRQYDK